MSAMDQQLVADVTLTALADGVDVNSDLDALANMLDPGARRLADDVKGNITSGRLEDALRRLARHGVAHDLVAPIVACPKAAHALRGVAALPERAWTVWPTVAVLAATLVVHAFASNVLATVVAPVFEEMGATMVPTSFAFDVIAATFTFVVCIVAVAPPALRLPMRAAIALDREARRFALAATLVDHGLPCRDALAVTAVTTATASTGLTGDALRAAAARTTVRAELHAGRVQTTVHTVGVLLTGAVVGHLAYSSYLPISTIAQSVSP